MKFNTPKAKTRPKAIVLAGSTGVGKTELTETLFSTGFEIINSDSIQVYRYCDIGSAKPDKDLQKKIKHHLVDILEPYEQYTVGDFCHSAERLVHEINERGNIPLLTGGTAYYFRQFIYGKSETPPADKAIRERVRLLIKEKGQEEAYRILCEIDSPSAERININDVYRISRALEVYYQTGKPLSEYKVSQTIRDDIDFLVICLVRDKKELDARIDRRVDQMFDMGLYDEVKNLIKYGAKASWPAMNGIGYSEFFLASEHGEASISSIKKEIARNSRQYAKRQMTFFRSFENAQFVQADDKEKIEKLLATFLSS